MCKTDTEIECYFSSCNVSWVMMRDDSDGDDCFVMVASIEAYTNTYIIVIHRP